jgi:hypothetical protein
VSAVPAAGEQEAVAASCCRGVHSTVSRKCSTKRHEFNQKIPFRFGRLGLPLGRRKPRSDENRKCAPLGHEYRLEDIPEVLAVDVERQRAVAPNHDPVGVVCGEKPTPE